MQRPPLVVIRSHLNGEAVLKSVGRCNCGTMKDFCATIGNAWSGGARNSLLNDVAIRRRERDREIARNISKLNGLRREIATGHQIPLASDLGQIRGRCRRRAGCRLGRVRAEQIRVERRRADNPTLQRQGNRIRQHCGVFIAPEELDR